jgi:putative transposase
MKNGFLYLTAIIDVYSRYIVGWGISNTLEAEASVSVLKQAIKDNGCIYRLKTIPNFG